LSLNDWLVVMAIWFAAGIPLGPNALNCIVVSAPRSVDCSTAPGQDTKFPLTF
jgi:hypothetical protein